MDYRQYDNALGRFNSIDVLSEFYEDTSPYAFSLNSPVFFADPTGLCPECEKNVKKPTEGQQYNSTGGATYTYTDGKWNREGGELDEVVVTSSKKEEAKAEEGQEGKKEGSVGQPGTAESMIPIWGSGRAAVDHFQNGNYWQGTFYTAMAVSDVFLVKSIATGLAKGGLKLAGSSSWGATRKYYLKNGFAKPNQPLHHWLIQQNGRLGKHLPNSFKNQMWNLKSFSTASMHMRAGHGYNYMGEQGFNLMGRLWYGTPTWPKLVIGSYGGRLVGEEFNDSEDGE